MLGNSMHSNSSFSTPRINQMLKISSNSATHDTHTHGYNTSIFKNSQSFAQDLLSKLGNANDEDYRPIKIACDVIEASNQVLGVFLTYFSQSSCTAPHSSLELIESGYHAQTSTVLINHATVLLTSAAKTDLEKFRASSPDLFVQSPDPTNFASYTTQDKNITTQTSIEHKSEDQSVKDDFEDIAEIAQKVLDNMSTEDAKSQAMNELDQELIEEKSIDGQLADFIHELELSGGLAHNSGAEIDFDEKHDERKDVDFEVAQKLQEEEARFNLLLAVTPEEEYLARMRPLQFSYHSLTDNLGSLRHAFRTQVIATANEFVRSRQKMLRLVQV